MKKLPTLLIFALLSLLYGDRSYDNGVKQLKAKEYDLALKSFYVSARHNNTNAYVMLGKMHEEALGTGANYQIAYYWYEKSAQKNHPSAQYSLGHLYEEGLGVNQDVKKAKMWYKRAAQAGNKEARIKLAQKIPIQQKEKETTKRDSSLSWWSNFSGENDPKSKEQNQTEVEAVKNNTPQPKNSSKSDEEGFFSGWWSSDVASEGNKRITKEPKNNHKEPVVTKGDTNNSDGESNATQQDDNKSYLDVMMFWRQDREGDSLTLFLY